MKLLLSLAILIVLVFVLVGCGGQAETPRAVLKVTVDNYCRLTEPLTWVPADSNETITGVRRSERVRVCTCQKPRPKECASNDSRGASR